MSIKIFTDVVVINNLFSIKDVNEKPQIENSALITLKNIEKVMQKNLKYNDKADDSYSKKTPEALMASLKIKAESIRNGYNAKLWVSIRKFFGFHSNKDKEIQMIYEHIVKLTEPSSLPPDMIRCISGFLPATFSANFKQVNKLVQASLKSTEIIRAQEYGYKGRDQLEAVHYLKNLFQGVSILGRYSLPKEFVVENGKAWPGDNVDSEATLRKVMNSKENEQLKLKLNTTLLCYSINGNNPNVLTALLKMGADLETTDIHGNTALALAARYGKENFVEHLIKAGADVNIINNQGNTPLLLAIHYNNSTSAAICRLLLDNGAKKTINHRNNSGYSALHLAIGRNQEKILKLLVEFGADLEVRDNQGLTPLALLAEKRHERGLKLLIKAGADVNALSNDGSTPLLLTITNSLYAFSESCESTCRLLLENGAQTTINHVNNHGDTALHKAAKKFLFSTVELLLKHGVNRDILNAQGKTALDLVQAWDYYNIRKLLQTR